MLLQTRPYDESLVGAELLEGLILHAVLPLGQVFLPAGTGEHLRFTGPPGSVVLKAAGPT